MQATSGATTSRVAEPDLPRLDPVRLSVVHRALEEADRVEGRQRDADRGHERVDDLRLEDADQDVELADEVGRARASPGSPA